MSKIKEYISGLAEKLNKDFDEVTDEDMELDFRNNAQKVWADENSTEKELESCKQYLDKIPYSKVCFYDAETDEGPKFKVGSVLMKGDGLCYLVVADKN